MGQACTLRAMTTALEKARAAKGLTQAELAVAAGLNRRTIARAENGDPPSRYATRYRIAQALAVAVEDLFEESATA